MNFSIFNQQRHRAGRNTEYRHIAKALTLCASLIDNYTTNLEFVKTLIIIGLFILTLTVTIIHSCNLTGTKTAQGEWFKEQKKKK